ncbi:MAG: cytochrome P450 [Acidimicrobiales bacterium]
MCGIHHNPEVWADPERFEPRRFDESAPDSDADDRPAVVREVVSASIWPRPSSWWPLRRWFGRSSGTPRKRAGAGCRCHAAAQ